MAYPFADRYLNQFPKDKTNQAMQFVSLVAGTIAAVLGIATLFDPELFLGFEVTPGRTAFFYLSVSMGIFATARNAVPDDNEVHEPVLHLFEVIEYTHYCPVRWRKHLHSNNVRNEFSALYQMKVLIFLEEILSLVVAPLILWRNSGRQAKEVIDFFRQYTVHVDGLGPLCHHAVFEFRKRKNAEDDDVGAAKATASNSHTNTNNNTNTNTDPGTRPHHTPTTTKDLLRDEYYGPNTNRDEKMALSQYYFMQRLGNYDQQQASGRLYRRGYQHAQQYQHVPLPPSFPPLSPLREAAAPMAAVGTARRRALPGSDGEVGNGGGMTAAAESSTKTQRRSPSPRQSLLLDLAHARRPRKQVARDPGRRGHEGRRSATTAETRRRGADVDGEGEHGDGTTPVEFERGVSDMTSSRLIEQDRSLADSWKRDGEIGLGDDDFDDDDVTIEEGGRKTRKGQANRNGEKGVGDDDDDDDHDERGRGNGVLGLLVEYSKAHADGRGARRGSRIAS